MLSKDTDSKEFSIIFVVMNLFFLLRMVSYFNPHAVDERIIILIRICLSIFFLFRIIMGRKILCKEFVGSALLFWIISLLSNAFSNQSISDLLLSAINQSWWLLLLLYVASVCKRIDKRALHNITITSYIFVCVYLSVYTLWLVSTNRYWSAGGINAVYYPLLLLPITYYGEKRLPKIMILLLFGIVLTISAKRTAFFALLAIAFVPELLGYADYKNNRKRISRICLLLILCIIFYFVVEHYSNTMSSNLFLRLTHLTEDGGSGRVQIYEKVWSAYKNEDIIHRLLGHGFNGVSLTTNIGTSAHNDFLEILYDYGVVALVTYIVYVIKLIVYSFSLRRQNSIHYSAFITSIVVYIIMSSTSHLIIYPTYIAYPVIVFALSLKQISTNE